MELTYGDPRVARRIWDRLEEDSQTGCWVWFGSETPHGWPVYSRRAVWRLLYEKLVGPVPPEVRMTCGSDSKLCCNPYHRLNPFGQDTTPHLCPVCQRMHDPDGALNT